MIAALNGFISTIFIHKNYSRFSSYTETFFKFKNISNYMFHKNLHTHHRSVLLTKSGVSEHQLEILLDSSQIVVQFTIRYKEQFVRQQRLPRTPAISNLTKITVYHPNWANQNHQSSFHSSTKANYNCWRNVDVNNAIGQKMHRLTRKIWKKKVYLDTRLKCLIPWK